MTQEEVNAIINLADVNADGRFDYMKVHNAHIDVNLLTMQETQF